MCPPSVAFWVHLLVRPRASFRPGLHVCGAVARRGGQGRPSRQPCRRLRHLQAAPCMRASKSSTYFTACSTFFLHFPCPSFFVRLGIPFLRSRPTRTGRRCAQGPSRSAVAQTSPHAPPFPGRIFTAPSTPAC